MRVTINKEYISESKRRVLSPLQKEYRKFVKRMLKEQDKSSPFEGSPDDIVDFLEELSRKWKKYKKDNGLLNK